MAIIKELTRTISGYKARLHNGSIVYLVNFFDIHSEAYSWCKERLNSFVFASKKESKAINKIGRTKRIYRYKYLGDYQ